MKKAQPVLLEDSKLIDRRMMSQPRQAVRQRLTASVILQLLAALVYILTLLLFRTATSVTTIAGSGTHPDSRSHARR
jgi:hypothetical protein